MKILIISDAWKPQINGVVRTYEDLCRVLSAQGHDPHVIGPADFPFRMAMPGYSEIELVIAPYKRLARMIEDYAPDAIHIATEGPLGCAAQRYCRKKGLKYSTCYHTHFPDYVAKRVGRFFPFLYNWARNHAIKKIKKFHDQSHALMVATQSLEDDLKEWNFIVPMHRLTRGVDMDVFKPGKGHDLSHMKSPIALYVGRVAIEKNLEDFLGMEWEGSKIVIGDGPAREELEAKYKDAHFVGKRFGEDLANYYRAADIFVFPSRTDTFGIVLIEALACGLPVAGYNVTGPKDIITQSHLGALHDHDLAEAAKEALIQKGTAQQLYDHVFEHYTWDVATTQFLEAHHKIDGSGTKGS
jgi:glycosyltransferase involved in cell wall biosynthesis